jgi:hypothetical protein
MRFDRRLGVDGQDVMPASHQPIGDQRAWQRRCVRPAHLYAMREFSASARSWDIGSVEFRGKHVDVTIAEARVAQGNLGRLLESLLAAPAMGRCRRWAGRRRQVLFQRIPVELRPPPRPRETRGYRRESELNARAEPPSVLRWCASRVRCCKPPPTKPGMEKG